MNLDIIQQRLYQISDALVKTMKSKHIKMSELLVPLSMALLTVYDEEYLGIATESDEKDEAQTEKGNT